MRGAGDQNRGEAGGGTVDIGVIPEDARRGDVQRGVFVRGVSIVHRNRWIVDRSDGDRDGGDVRICLAVVRLVSKRVAGRFAAIVHVGE